MNSYKQIKEYNTSIGEPTNFDGLTPSGVRVMRRGYTPNSLSKEKGDFNKIPPANPIQGDKKPPLDIPDFIQQYQHRNTLRMPAVEVQMTPLDGLLDKPRRGVTDNPASTLPRNET